MSNLETALANLTAQMEAATTYQEYFRACEIYVGARQAAGHPLPYRVPASSGKPNTGACAYCGRKSD